MESTPVSGKDGTEGSSQDNLLHAAKPLDEEGTNIVVLENEGGASSSSGDKVRAERAERAERAIRALRADLNLLKFSSSSGDSENEGGRSGSRSMSSGWATSVPQPSYDRIPEPREFLEILDEERMTNQYVPGRSVVIIRTRATSSRVKLQDEEIAEEEAVCKFCFDVLKEKSTLKTVCKCKNALIHEECAAKWIREKGNNNCDVCGEKVENFPVTLLRGLSSTRRAEAKKRNTNSCFSRLRM